MALLVAFGTAMLGGCETTLITPIPPTDLAICLGFPDCPGQTLLLEGETLQLEARLTGPEGQVLAGRPVTWTSSDPSVATVASDGAVAGVGEGAAVVRAEAAGLSASIGLTVLKGPTLLLETALLQLQGPSGEPPLQVPVEIENAGNGTLSGLTASVETDGATTGWLVATLESSTAPTSVLVEVILAELPSGSYSGRVTIEGENAVNGPQTVEVAVEVGEPLPKINLNPTAASLGAAAGTVQPATQDVEVENTGGGVLDGLSAAVTYVSGGAGGWVTTSFIAPQAPTTLEIQASARFLAPGTYVADIEVTATSAPGTAATVRVTFTVQ